MEKFKGNRKSGHERKALTSAFSKAMRNFGASLPIIAGVILMLGVFRAFVPNRFFSAVFTGEVLRDTLTGAMIGSVSAGSTVNSYIIAGELIEESISLIAVTSFMVAWVTVGIIQLPAEASLLGRRFACVRNILSYILASPYFHRNCPYIANDMMKQKQANRNDEAKEKNARPYYGLYLLGAVLFLYVLLFILDPAKTRLAIGISANASLQILPSLLLIVVLMGSINYFLHPKSVSKYVGRGSGIKGWMLAVVAGVLSHGPVYAWYPLLRELRSQEMTNGHIAVFLYNRAIKLPLLPLMIHYFGVRFVVLLISHIVIASLIEGWLVQLLVKSRYHFVSEVR